MSGVSGGASLLQIPAELMPLAAAMKQKRDTNGTACGEAAQVSSQVPGLGPCYPVWANTVPWLNRCGLFN